MPAGDGPSLPPVRDRLRFGRAEDGCKGELEVISCCPDNTKRREVKNHTSLFITLQVFLWIGDTVIEHLV